MRVISGTLKGRIIKGYTLNGTRPTMDRVKESIFSMIQNNIKDSICLDLFSGSGSLGIEAISNGAKKCYFVDKSKDAIKIINENIINFKIESNTVVIKNDYMNILNDFRNNKTKFDIIFLDPPYNLMIINEIIDFITKNNIINDNGLIIAEVDNKYLNQNINGFNIIKEKKYGTTHCYIYKK